MSLERFCLQNFVRVTMEKEQLGTRFTYHQTRSREGREKLYNLPTKN
ncbi:hypothetical protein IC582_018589 [Cucumis melo]